MSQVTKKRRNRYKVQNILREEAQVKFPAGEFEIHGYPFTVEVAESAEQRALGLSGRKYMPAGTGMLFMMGGGPAAFHMRDTHFPLDILYLDGGGVVIMKDRMHPHTGNSSCAGDVHYVVELPIGTCDELAIEVGDTLHRRAKLVENFIVEYLRSSS